ncbi:hypothetical protein WICPIJ_001043 [Wickerhamomyces pijperi]|uniref:Uncharacterized protein n=1 Tax=Wickerhamomyces pijperi TaxID=599730 RepID=A0A9P8TRR0_WICPI|nr:hypothetical protein WICPIJ_001043 [Wickerhamomyces pijperi]
MCLEGEALAGGCSSLSSLINFPLELEYVEGMNLSVLDSPMVELERRSGGAAGGFSVPVSLCASDQSVLTTLSFVGEASDNVELL